MTEDQNASQRAYFNQRMKYIIDLCKDEFVPYLRQNIKKKRGQSEMDYEMGLGATYAVVASRVVHNELNFTQPKTEDDVEPENSQSGDSRTPDDKLPKALIAAYKEIKQEASKGKGR